MTTDTRAIPRVVLYASAPLAPPSRRRPLRAALLLALFVVGVVLAVVAGRAAAWQADTPGPVAEVDVQRIELDLPVIPDYLGTDAGLITTPAGDL